MYVAREGIEPCRGWGSFFAGFLLLHTRAKCPFLPHLWQYEDLCGQSVTLWFPPQR